VLFLHLKYIKNLTLGGGGYDKIIIRGYGGNFMNKKREIVIVIILLVITMILGTSYALWQITLKQESTNAINTACFKLSLNDKNNIEPEKSTPISDKEGFELTPYTFTITNECNIYASYEVNLEEIETNLKRLPEEYLKISIDEITKKLTKFDNVKPTLDDSIKAHKITMGYLAPNESVSYDLRIWIGDDTPAIDEVMNATHQSKITITSTYQNNFVIPYLDNVKASNIPPKDDKYKFERFECNNDIDLNWNNESWSYTLTNLKQNKSQNVCNIYFKTIEYDVIFYSEKATFENNKVLTNLLINGSFENDLNAWSSMDFAEGRGKISALNSKTGGKSLHITDTVNNKAFWIYQDYTKQPKINDIIYQGSEIYNLVSNSVLFNTISYWKDNYWVSTALSKVDIRTVTNGFKHISNYYKVNNASYRIHAQFGSSNADISEGYIDDVYVINLTNTFGSGNEPSKEWVDKYIPYFNTTANIAVEKIEKLEEKTFLYNLSQEANITCTNASFETTDNTVTIKNATDDVYCKIG